MPRDFEIAGCDCSKDWEVGWVVILLYCTCELIQLMMQNRGHSGTSAVSGSGGPPGVSPQSYTPACTPLNRMGYCTNSKTLLSPLERIENRTIFYETVHKLDGQFWCMWWNTGSLTLSLPSDQFQISPAASPEMSHHTVWRTWLFIAYSDVRWLYYPIDTVQKKKVGRMYTLWNWEWKA